MMMTDTLLVPGTEHNNTYLYIRFAVFGQEERGESALPQTAA